MPVKKSKSDSKRKRKIKVEDRDVETVEHYNAVLIEDLHSKMGLVIENMTGVEARLSEKMDSMQQENNKRFDNIEAVLQYHSTILNKHSTLLNENEERWKRNEERWNQNEERWNQNEQRLDRIETKLDKVADKVEQHDKDIQEIKAVVFTH